MVTTADFDNNREPFQFANNGSRAKLAGCSIRSASRKVDESKQTLERDVPSVSDERRTSKYDPSPTDRFSEEASLSDGSVLAPGIE